MLCSTNSGSLNFAVSNSKIPTFDIIASVENTARKLNKEDAQRLRTGVANILKKGKIPKRNLSHKLHLALKNFKRNNSIVILPADKGNATVLMDKCDYNMKMKNLLEHKTTYKKLSQNPTNKIDNKINKVLKKYEEKNYLTRDQRLKLSPQNSIPPQI